MSKRLILFVGVYDTLDIFTYELNRAFKSMGYITMLFDSRKTEESLIELSEFIKQPITAMLTFNNLGFNMELVEGHNLWDELNIPCINILMDHPFCYKNALEKAPRNSIVLCPDRNHMNYLNRFYPNIPITGFLPHAGKELPGKKKPIADRSIEIMYAGNLSKSFADNIKPDMADFDFDADKLCKAVYEDVIKHPYKTTEQGIEEQLRNIKPDISEQELCELIAKLHFIDLYIVSYYRERTVEAVALAGMELHLFGAGWENCAWIHQSNVHYYGKVSADTVVEKMQDAKLVLSTMTWFKDGTHDRVFNGMLQGAIAVTDSSLYMLEEFENEKELVMFELEEISKLPERLKELLADGTKAQALADAGYQKAMSEHTWGARAKELHQDLLVELGADVSKRLLFVSHQLSRTGAPLVLLDMIKLYKENGYQVDVISMLDGELREVIEQDGISVEIWESIYDQKEAFLELARGYDAVICNTLITYEAILVLNRTDIPVIWWLHEGRQYFEYFQSVIPDFKTIGSNIHTYAVGHYVQEVIRSIYHTEVPILHFAVMDTFDSHSKITYTSGDKVRFLTAGTYSGVKAQDILAEAIRLLPQDYLARCEFSFCGNEEMVDEEIYRSFVKLCEDYPNVMNLHKLSREETMAAMQEADCLIVPSRIDPIPTVAVEIMMNHKPCLCTDVCGIAHYITDSENGFTVPVEDAKTLSEKICYIIDHKSSLKEIGEAGRKIYEEHFSKEVVEEQMLQVIRFATRMSIMCVVNRNYRAHLKTFLHSLFDTNTNGIDVYMLYSDLKQEDIEEIKSFAKAWYDKSIIPIYMEAEKYSNLYSTESFPIEVYYKLLCAEVLPDKLDKVICMDLDMIVKKPLKCLWNTDIRSVPLAACQDIYGYVYGKAQESILRLEIKEEKPYFNAGMVVYNLDYFRRNHSGESMIAYAKKYRNRLLWPEQDVENVFFIHEYLELPWQEYNCPPIKYVMKPEQVERQIYRPLYKSETEQIENLEEYADYTKALYENASVIHYIGETKPWRNDRIRTQTFSIFDEAYQKYK